MSTLYLLLLFVNCMLSFVLKISVFHTCMHFKKGQGINKDQGDCAFSKSRRPTLFHLQRDRSGEMGESWRRKGLWACMGLASKLFICMDSSFYVACYIECRRLHVFLRRLLREVLLGSGEEMGLACLAGVLGSGTFGRNHYI